MADQNDITFKDDTVPTASFDANTTVTGASSEPATGAVAKIRDGASHLISEAGSAAMTAASEGKEKAAAALTSLTQTVENAAQLIDEKVGPQYSGYVRRAGTAVSDFTESLQGKNVDELLDDTREYVRRSPMVAIGAAIAVGFVLTRLIKVGTEGVETTTDRSTGSRNGRNTGRTDGTGT